MTNPVAIRSLRAFSYRYPLQTPVETSFGRMLDRPAVFIRIEDDDGHVGWGEAWSNFPSVGAEHRARIVNEIIAPAVTGFVANTPHDLFDHLSMTYAVLALQTGEHGPFAQSIAGIDIAMWDLAARRQAQPLWRLLGGNAPRINVYASGINPAGAERTAEAALRAGHRALKLKIGFGAERDIANLTALRALAGDDLVATDANQGWSLEQALAFAPELDRFSLAWLEEPLRADQPWPAWLELKKRIRTPLAGGENIAGQTAFKEAFAAGALDVIQPDIAKWGGFSQCVAVGRAARAAGKTFCPHYLGGGIGLLASAHLLAAVGGDGWLEVDFNPNPLRDALCGPVGDVHDGSITLTDAPGLGISPDLAAFEAYRTA
jgi:L-alanine-DL-glutamate epimerase-like enolase superfamily enzyme